MQRSGVPLPGIQAQRPRTRTARTTRQINAAIPFNGYAAFGEKSSSVGVARVQRPLASNMFLLIRASNNTGVGKYI